MRVRYIARSIAALGAVGILIVVALAGYMIHRRAPDNASDHSAMPIPASLVHANDFRWTLVKNGHKQWELTAQEGTYSEDRTKVTLNLAILHAWAEDGQQMVLQAKKGVLKLSGSQIRQADLSGGVTIKYSGFVLNTPEAVFFPAQDRLLASGEVHIKGEGITAEGVGMEAQLRARMFTLKNQVVTEITSVKTQAATPTRPPQPS